MTVNELITEITDVTGDSDTSTTDKILIFVKDALRRLPRFAKERSVINRTTLSLSADAQTVSISSLTDFFEVYSMWIEVDGRREFIVKPSKDAFNKIFSSNATGRPQLFRIISNANTIEFERKADQAYTITLEYFGVDSNVTTATTLIFRDDINLILKDLVWEQVRFDREEMDKHEKSLAKAVAGLEELETAFHRQEDPDFISSSSEEVSNIF